MITTTMSAAARTTVPNTMRKTPQTGMCECLLNVVADADSAFRIEPAELGAIIEEKKKTILVKHQDIYIHLPP